MTELIPILLVLFGFGATVIGTVLFAFAIIRKRSKRGPVIVIVIGLLVGLAGLFVTPTNRVDSRTEGPTPVVIGSRIGWRFFGALVDGRVYIPISYYGLLETRPSDV